MDGRFGTSTMLVLVEKKVLLPTRAMDLLQNVA
jgi:hypothetical protein